VDAGTALVVLDEPNANLDADGDAALREAIEVLRKGGSTVVVMAHRPSAIAAVDKILMLNGGRQVEFGSKNEILPRVTRVVHG
jgi:ATP-binding cassette, subfamily C, bacterial exporter for protease/lipase